jgi:hypothetical protein
MLISQPAAGIVTAILVMKYAHRLTAAGININLVFIPAVILATCFMRALFATILSAKCPKCQAALAIEGVCPITYQCTRCVFFRRSIISEGEN